MWLWIVVFVILLVYLFGIKPYKHWKHHGVPYIKPVPFIGNFGQSLLQQKSMADLVQEFYSAYPDKRYVGVYSFTSPILLIRDPELIKTLAVKDFDAFPEHRTIVSPEADPIFAKNVFAIKGYEKWHSMRSTLSPSFTSSKMKMMFGLMKECSKQFVQHFEREGGAPEIEMKDALTRFANDVIATTAFGVTVDSLKVKENQFYLMGKELTTFRGVRGLQLLLASISPTLAKLFNIRLFPASVVQFFEGVISESIRVRKERGIVRPDMIHLLLEAQRNYSSEDKKVKITNEDILGQAIGFFSAGFDSAATFMCFMCYELAVNPDIQGKLRGEIDEAYEKCSGDITYEGLMGMKYLDMVTSETLRKWPPIMSTDRVSVRSYTIQPEHQDEKPVTLEANTCVWFPTFSLQRDLKYFPDPEKFDPERFSDENKDKIHHYTFLAFGAGPRNCLGNRFALLEGKLIVAEILRAFEIVAVAKTKIPLELDPGSFIVTAKDGFWLGLKLRRS